MTELHIKITPKASSNRIVDEQPDMFGDIKTLKVYVTAVPENGKANEAMIALLAKHFDLPKSAFTIVRGATSRNKVVRIK